MRTIVGRVVAGAMLGDVVDLGGLVIVAQPDGIETQTDPEGRFIFARVAFAPATTLAIESQSLPSRARAPEPMPFDTPDLTFTLVPQAAVERRVFPAVR